MYQVKRQNVFSEVSTVIFYVFGSKGRFYFSFIFFLPHMRNENKGPVKRMSNENAFMQNDNRKVTLEEKASLKFLRQ